MIISQHHHPFQPPNLVCHLHFYLGLPLSETSIQKPLNLIQILPAMMMRRRRKRKTMMMMMTTLALWVYHLITNEFYPNSADKSNSIINITMDIARVTIANKMAKAITVKIFHATKLVVTSFKVEGSEKAIFEVATLYSNCCRCLFLCREQYCFD